MQLKDLPRYQRQELRLLAKLEKQEQTVLKISFLSLKTKKVVRQISSKKDIWNNFFLKDTLEIWDKWQENINPGHLSKFSGDKAVYC